MLSCDSYIYPWAEFGQRDASETPLNRQLLEDMRSDLEVRQCPQNVYKFVTDANFLWNVVGHYLYQTTKHPAIVELSLAGFCELHAPVWLLKELKTSVFPNMARKHRISARELNTVFDEFVRPHIVFHDAYEPLDTNYCQDGIDPADVPYADLAADIDALGVVSNDKDIDALLTRRFDKNKIEICLVIARLENGILRAKVVAYMSMIVGWNISAEVSKFAVSKVRAVPKNVQIVVGVAVVGAALWYFSDEKRRKSFKETASKAMPLIYILGENLTEGTSWVRESQLQANDMRQDLEKKI